MENHFLPAGFRFHPTDEELIVHYLKKKITSSTNSIASIIADIDLYKFNPWELSDKASFGENEWFFYTPRDRKYPNGARPNRATTCGYWKATGCDKPILSSKGSQCVGVKKALVFYQGRPPKGTKTSWMMYEYRLPNHSIRSSRLRGSMRLDDWVLCRIRQKSNDDVTKENRKRSSISSSSFSDIEPFEEKDIMENINYFEDYGLVPQKNEVTDNNLQGETTGNLDSDGNFKSDIEMASSVKETLATIRRMLSITNLDEQMQFLPDESMFTHF